MYLKPKLADHPGPPKTSKEKWSRRFQYLYFLRFCLLGSLLLPLLCVLDYLTGVSALSRGIITLTTGWQAFHAVFFVVTFATTTLVCARNIVMNGNFRFVSQPPMKLYEWMTSTDRRIVDGARGGTDTGSHHALVRNPDDHRRTGWLRSRIRTC